MPTMIFISYNQKHDRREADFVASLLERHGFSVWRDVRNIAPGQPFEDAVTEAIRSASLFIGILSPQACASEHVRNEWSLAGGRSPKLRLLPILLRGHAVEDLRGPMEYYAKSTQHLRLDRLDEDSAHRLVEAVRGLLNTAAPAAAPTGSDRRLPAVPGIWLRRFAVGAVVLLAVFGAAEWLRRNFGEMAATPPEAQAPDPVAPGDKAPPSAIAVGQPSASAQISTQPPPLIQGAWDFTTTVEASRYKPFIGLVSVYRISLFRLADGRVSGNGELWSERGEEVVGRNHLPIVFEGSQDGETIHLTFRVESVSRPVTGGAELHWDRAAAQWSGTFYSGAGASTGAVVLVGR